MGKIHLSLLSIHKTARTLQKSQGKNQQSASSNLFARLTKPLVIATALMSTAGFIPQTQAQGVCKRLNDAVGLQLPVR